MHLLVYQDRSEKVVQLIYMVSSPTSYCVEHSYSQEEKKLQVLIEHLCHKAAGIFSICRSIEALVMLWRSLMPVLTFKLSPAAHIAVEAFQPLSQQY